MTDEELGQKISEGQRGRHLAFHVIADRLNEPLDRVKIVNKWYKSQHPVARGGNWKNRTGQPESFNAKIMSRYMSEEDMKTFIEKYSANRKAATGTSRQNILEKPISKEELDSLRDYATNFKLSTLELTERYKFKGTSIYSAILRVAVKVITQYPEVLDLVQTEG